jgi:hypothetical protein
LLISDNTNFETTYAIALDFQLDQAQCVKYKEIKQLTITNIESYYNYRTIDEDFKLVTSVLSLQSSFMQMKVVAQPGFLSQYSVRVEEEKQTIDESIPLSNIHFKKLRISSALFKIKNTINANDNLNSSLLDYFSMNPGEIVPDYQIIDLPLNCRSVNRKKNTHNNKKKPCSSCVSECSLSLQSLKHSRYAPTFEMIKDELETHGHSRTRIIKTADGKAKQQQKEAAIRELVEHYKFALRLIEPDI